MDDRRSLAGAGGKTPRRPLRARPSPYARPNQAAPQHQQQQRSGWFSKLVVRPAARILPSLFSSSASATRDPDPHPLETLPENEPDEFISLEENDQEDADADTTFSQENKLVESKVLGASDERSRPKLEFNGDELVRDKQGDAHDCIALDEIERRLKHKMFTRDESDRLIELLRSRTTDLSDDNANAAGCKVESVDNTLSQNDSRTLVKENVFDHRLTLKSSEPFTLVHKNLRTSVNEGSVDHQTFLKPSTENDVGSSPIDVAKAYMEARKSASGYDSQSIVQKNEKKPIDDDGFALSLSSAVKSPVCWPGAVVHGDSGYLTPQIQRGRIGQHNFPRTPYSGAIFSRSASKGVGERSNMSTVCRKQSYTAVFGGNMSRRSSVLNDSLTQVNSVRQVRQRSMATTASKGAGSSNLATAPSSVSNSPFDLKGNSSAYQERGSSKGSYQNFRPIHEDGDSSIFTASSTIHPHSSKMAQKILEHLDRPVFPKEKSFELELAFARTKSPPKAATILVDEHDKRSDVRTSDDLKSGSIFGREMGTQETKHPQKDFSWTSKSQDKDQISSLPLQTLVGLSSSSAASGLFQLPKSQAHSYSEPVSSSVSAMKPSENVKTTENGFGFTFPAPPVSSVFFEPPPTPTMNSTLAANWTRPTSNEPIPTFNFGTSKADDQLVFSFGSLTSSAITDAVAPTFKFGSDEKRSLSFKCLPI